MGQFWMGFNNLGEALLVATLLCVALGLYKMRNIREWTRRYIGWPLEFSGSKWDSFFRGAATVVVQEEERPVLNNRYLDDWQLQTLAMCPAGGTVEVYLDAKEGKIYLSSSHRDLIEHKEKNCVIIQRDASGFFLYVDLVLFTQESDPKRQKRGFGATAIFRMAQTAQRLGFQRIDLLAAGGTGYKHSWTRKFNGYYSWARFGFDTALWPQTIVKLRGYPKLKHCRRLREVMLFDPNWWKVNGDGCPMSFDLRPKSISWHTLNTYLKEKRS